VLSGSDECQNQIVNDGSVDQAQHVFDILMLDSPLTIGNRLIVKDKASRSEPCADSAICQIAS
jgi:hypothetical protein